MRAATVCLLIALLAPAASAQVTGAAIVGRVSDEAKRPIGGAEVTATHVATGLSRTLKSGRDGRYRFPSLPVGSYEVTAGMKGYATVSVRKIDLLLGVARHVDIRLKHVEEEEELTITAPVRVVEAGPATGAIVRRELLADLPLRSRSASELADLAPFRPSVERILDGAIAVSDPPIDAIEQVNSVSSQYPAEYGRTSGGVLMIATRKGTDDFEGDAFAFYRNREDQWQWGAAAGGPIVKGTSHAFAAVDRGRVFAGANADVSSRHFIDGEFGNRENNGAIRDLWLAHKSLWNELVLRRAPGANEIRESLAGSYDTTSMRHDWTAGGLSIENGGNAWFAQDQITFTKLVFNAGVRYDRGFSPRAGATYDVNGSGRNLLRASIGRYRHPDLDTASLGYSWQVNPWVALNFDALHETRPHADERNAIAVSGQVQFATFISVAGSYTYGDDAQHDAAVAGTIHLPAGFWLSGVGRYHSGWAEQTDLRAAKTFDLDRVSLDAIFDVFNAFGEGRTAEVGGRVRF